MDKRRASYTAVAVVAGSMLAVPAHALIMASPTNNTQALGDGSSTTRSVTITEALQVIGEFGRFGRVTLGLNLKEAQQVHLALGFHSLPEDEAGLRQLAADIRAKLNYATVVVHPKESAACATAETTAWIPGPYTSKPKITTGAGDHFNAGFTLGQVLGLSPEACLTTGVCTSGHYVRTAQSPSIEELQTFLANWN